MNNPKGKYMIPRSTRRYIAQRALLGERLELARDVLFEVSPEGSIARLEPGGRAPDAALLEGVVCPGLIDCHVHLVLPGAGDVEGYTRSLDREGAMRAAVESARAHLRCGVTTVRDLGSPWDVAVALQGEPGDPSLPRVAAAGAVTNTGGHGSLFARQADGAEMVRSAVEEIARSGARWLKIFPTGSITAAHQDAGHRQMSDEELRAAVEAARLSQLGVAAHAHGGDGIRAAIEAGVDSIEHVTYADLTILQELRVSASTPVSTYVSTRRLCDALDPRSTDSAPFFKHAHLEQRALELLIESGMEFAAGTDAGTPFNPHGGGLQHQAVLMQQAGMHPRQVLRTLTVNGARLLGEPSGVLEVGRHADWVVLEDDPVKDVGLLSSVRAVSVGGRVTEVVGMH